MKATTIAPRVTRDRRSPSTIRASTTATRGVIDPRKEALAAVVVFTAYMKASEASSSPTLAVIIHRPDV